MNWSYVAGFFDGEGSLTIYQNSKWNDGCPKMLVGFSQKNVAVLNEIVAFMRSEGILVRKPYYYPAQKRPFLHGKQYDLYEMKIGKRSHIEAFLKKIHPHVVVKKDLVEKALLLLQFPKTYAGTTEPYEKKMGLA